MNKQQKNTFLRKGGTLLRYHCSEKGEHTIQKKTNDCDWFVHLTCTSQEICETIINRLIETHPTKFQKG
jgi:hypothetical protein